MSKTGGALGSPKVSYSMVIPLAAAAGIGSDGNEPLNWVLHLGDEGCAPTRRYGTPADCASLVAERARPASEGKHLYPRRRTSCRTVGESTHLFGPAHTVDPEKDR